MAKFAEATGRVYRPVEYFGAEDAERIVVIMGSGAETARETARYLMRQDEKVGVLQVRLFRPFPGEQLLDALPASTKAIAVLDRSKEPGAVGEALYCDVVTTLAQGVIAGNLASAELPRVIGGRYGLSSKEFTPAMVKAIFENLASDAAKPHFTIGINDDITHLSLEWDKDFHIERDDVVRAMFYGLGADGTVGANKNSIKIIGGAGRAICA